MNNVLSHHEWFMSHALDLALKGQYTARPNPMVGCVLVKSGQILAKGYHAYCGGHHAEIMALTQAKEAGISLEGATAYITLAPCCHVGKTPPCVEALVQANVNQVIYAIEDPNPITPPYRAKNVLEASGIQVITGILAERAYHLNRGFIRRMQHQRPYVRAKVALSLDGNMALKNHQSQWITGEAARERGQHYRAISGAIITGIGTVIHDDPSLTVRSPLILNKAINQNKFTQPFSVLINPKEGLISDKKILSRPDTLIFKGETDLSSILKTLALTYEINEVLLESGPGLLNQFLDQNLIDELIIFLAPKLLGKEAKNMSQFGPIEQLVQAKEWVFQTVEPIGEDIMIIALPKLKRG